MSEMQLVDLDGKTWDGTPLRSKYRPMYDAHGRNEMMAITMGWLIDAPKFDLDKHDAEVRAKAIDEFVKAVENEVLPCEHEKMEYYSFLSVSTIKQIAEQLKAGGKDE